MSTLNRIMAVNLQASKAIAVDRFVGLQLTDVGKNDPKQAAHYTFNVRKGILEVNPPGAANEAFVIHTDMMTWKNLVLYKLDPKDAVDDDQVDDDLVAISGGTVDDFYAFMDLFDFGP